MRFINILSHVLTLVHELGLWKLKFFPVTVKIDEIMFDLKLGTVANGTISDEH